MSTRIRIFSTADELVDPGLGVPQRLPEFEFESFSAVGLGSTCGADGCCAFEACFATMASLSVEGSIAPVSKLSRERPVRVKRTVKMEKRSQAVRNVGRGGRDAQQLLSGRVQALSKLRIFLQQFVDPGGASILAARGELLFEVLNVRGSSLANCLLRQSVPNASSPRRS